jgi:hypothetical protein
MGVIRGFWADFAVLDERNHRKFAAMRQRFEAEPGLNLTPVEKIVIPLQSRDELPPILAGLQ